jgi:tetratricopeptide (TPR) repeat protein
MRRWVVLITLALAGIPATAVAQRVRLMVPLTDLEAQAARDSNDPMRHYDLALGYLLNRRVDDAERSLRTALEIDPASAPAHLGMAYVAYARNPRLWEIEEINEKTRPEIVQALEESARHRRQAFMLDPLVDLRVLGAIIPPQGRIGGGSGDIWNILLLGFENFWVGNHQESLRLLTTVIASVPERRRDRLPSFLYWYHGLAAAHVNDFTTANADFELLLNRAVERERDEEAKYFVQDPFRASNDYRYFLASIKKRAGASAEAITLLQECLTVDLSLYPAHTQLAAIHETRRNWLEAIAERERALAVQPDDPALLFDLGSTLSRSGDLMQSIEVLTRAMEANPRNSRIPYLLGMTAMRVRRHDVARPALQRFLALAPSRFGTQINQVRASLDSLPSTP